MDDDHTTLGEDTKQPFESIDGPQDDHDSQPDPDESLMMDAGNGRVWLVKVSVALGPS